MRAFLTGFDSTWLPYPSGNGSAGEGGALLVHGDSVEVLRTLSTSGSPPLDVVVTSPPYNLGIDYAGYDDTTPREQYLDWTETWTGVVKQVLAPDGSFFLNVGGKPTDPMVPFSVLDRATRGAGFTLQNVVHWVKSIAIMRDEVGSYPGLDADLVAGHYKPINSPRFLNDCHEYLFHLTHHGNVPLDRLAIGVPYRDKSNVGRWKSAAQDVHCRGNTWFLPYPTIQRRSRDRPHPATFPVELPDRCLRLHGIERSRWCLDPFLGLGSTGVACAGLEVSFLGIELCREYYEEAVSRVQAAVRLKSQGKLPDVRRFRPVLAADPRQERLPVESSGDR